MPHNHLTILTGASRGMGLAMAQQLLKSGNTLICIARSTNPDLAAEAKAAGATLEQWQQDLSQGEQAAHQLQAWLQAQGPQAFASATLINNAGVIPRIAPLSASANPQDLADLAHALRVGLEAPMQLTAAFLGATDSWTVPRKVLNISSGLGRRAMASQAAYCAAKAGMDHFTRCVALDEALKPHGAKVCSLAPGVIDTDMQVQLRGADPAAFPDRQNFANLKTGGQLTSPADAATRVLAWLERADFGTNPVADVREA
ncbi:SDR family NAD(P)-dependent oxidoreductase [Acidovorax kalamii]|jgi:NAD(P)-dependent dehydrogenase (short-subunit alcohol dehydrogenase family)|uniref:Short-chain dehydrogenase n=1 Tax=Acidovorax kalamii TaxID=2004485 RepID=A0A235EL54_9BURK|nr:SDR family NAD(P)-dependent oxidoreductase [Acidovorax kalamii]MCO5356654.1 SDR family NAD(P)-dependent oxidoreductase [Acidovorax kalamii]OYD49195.1 short-chain dehydrogenase [Acidovorax kalamii]